MAIPNKRIDILKVVQVRERRILYPSIIANKIRTPEDVRGIIEKAFDLQNQSVEHFGIVALNTKNAVAGLHIISIGTLDATLVHPREIFKAAILNTAQSIILFHNHPSGEVQPSKEDIEMTRRVVQSGEILGISVLDHLIIGDLGMYASLKELGVM